jgi:hypothetical protein
MEVRQPTVMSQVQGKPRYWCTVIQHPNNPKYFLILYSNSPSLECKNAVLGGKSNWTFYSRDTQSFIANSDGEVIQDGDIDPTNRQFVEWAVLNYQMIDCLEIVDDGWVSIMEAGLYQDYIETYQFTPIRRKMDFSVELSEGNLIFGACDKSKLPVVKVPPFVDVASYVEGNRDLKEYPDFEKFARPILRVNGPYTPVTSLYWGFMKAMDGKFPEGYIVLARIDSKQEFDITMRNAKAVLIDSPRDPLCSLDHKLSRILYKVPVVIVDDLSNKSLGRRATLSYDGSTYSID